VLAYNEVYGAIVRYTGANRYLRERKKLVAVSIASYLKYLIVFVRLLRRFPNFSFKAGEIT
jgi:hypothetical protein